MSNNYSNESVLDSKELSAFEIADKKRYEKLKNSPTYLGPEYVDINFDGSTIVEILGL